MCSGFRVPFQLTLFLSSSVPLDLGGLDPVFVAVSLAMLFVYFLVGIMVFSFVPLNTISNAQNESCKEYADGFWVTSGLINLCRLDAMTQIAPRSVCGTFAGEGNIWSKL